MTDDAKNPPAPVAPRANPDLIGHEAAEATLLQAWGSGRLPHGWLIGGPRGIGKATLAFRFARFVLAGGAPADMFGAPPSALAIDPASPVFHRVASGGHADLLTVERGLMDDRSARRRGDEGAVKRRSEIVVDDARAVAHFLHLTPAEGGWRVVVIDSADEMNPHAANAILKILEEPPRQALILIVSHAPGRLLPTIRSRCRRLDLRPLAEGHIVEILARQRPDLAPAEAAALARLADGSAGRALALAEAGGVGLYGEFLRLVADLPDLDIPAVHALGDRLTRPNAEASYAALTELIAWWLRRLVAVASGAGAPAADFVPGESAQLAALAARHGLDRWLDLWEKITRLFARADGNGLDRKQVLIGAFLALQSAARS
ncbi:MAG TPA: DNA polymerase III subunit delta' [Alphaproteobacteria bacterium]